MLEICFNFGYENDLLFNAKKSAYFAFGDLHVRASKAEIYIGEEKIAWVSVCNYLGVSVCSGKCFRMDCEEQRRKFCDAVNAIIAHNMLSEKCYMYIFGTQCVPILMYGASVRSCARGSLHRISVSFNDAVRKIFHYKRWESARIVLRGFGMVPMDLHLIRSRLLLLFNCMLSERRIVKVCSEINAYQEDVIDECRQFGVSWSCKKDGIWRVYVDKVGW